MKSYMNVRYQALIAASLALCFAHGVRAGEPISFETKSYRVTVHAHCAEYEVGCRDVTYTGVHKKSGKTIRLKGRDEHSLCKDGITPCRFLGYRFLNGAYTYRVTDNNRLIVSRGNSVILSEPEITAAR